MKLFYKNEPTIVTLSDHRRDCLKCGDVNLDKPATFVSACVLGSQLIMEELVKRQAPVEKEKKQAVEQWARDAGVFIKSRVKDPHTKYVEDK